VSAAAPTAVAGVPPKAGKKKLIAIVAVLVLLVGAAGGVALWMKSKAAAASAADTEEGAAVPEHKATTAKHDAKHPPSFLPLDPFVVNLADKDADRYAQIGITLEVDTPVFAEEMKTYMPAVRSAILMILAHKTSKELLEREGKDALAAEIMREAVRPMGIEIDPEDADDAKPAGDDDAAPKKKKKKRRAADYNPVQHVHFSNFIIQ